MSVQAYTLVQVFSVTHSKSIEGFCIYVSSKEGYCTKNDQNSNAHD